MREIINNTDIGINYEIFSEISKTSKVIKTEYIDHTETKIKNEIKKHISSKDNIIDFDGLNRHLYFRNFESLFYVTLYFEASLLQFVFYVEKNSESFYFSDQERRFITMLSLEEQPYGIFLVAVVKNKLYDFDYTLLDDKKFSIVKLEEYIRKCSNCNIDMVLYSEFKAVLNSFLKIQISVRNKFAHASICPPLKSNLMSSDIEVYNYVISSNYFKGRNLVKMINIFSEIIFFYLKYNNTTDDYEASINRFLDNLKKISEIHNSKEHFSKFKDAFNRFVDSYITYEIEKINGGFYFKGNCEQLLDILTPYSTGAYGIRNVLNIVIEYKNKFFIKKKSSENDIALHKYYSDIILECLKIECEEIFKDKNGRCRNAQATTYIFLKKISELKHINHFKIYISCGIRKK